MKIKFKMEIWQRSLIFQILDMDERARDEKLLYFSTNHWKIASAEWVYVSNFMNSIYILGVNRDKDKDVFVWNGLGKEMVEKKFIEIEQALHDFALNWEGWREKDINIPTLPIVNPYDQNIFEY